MSGSARARRIFAGELDQFINPQTRDEKRPGVPEAMIFADWKKMIDQTKPDIVWASGWPC